MNRQLLVAIGILALGASGVLGFEPPSRPRLTAKAEKPPRKVVIGTAMFGPYGAYPGLETRLREIGELLGEMAAAAAGQYPGKGLDLALLPETTVGPREGSAMERAIPLKGPVQDAFASLARKHKTYILAPFDLREEIQGKEVASNAAVLFNREGEVAGIYRKAHPVALVNNETLEDGITPGREYPVFDCDFGRLGVQICWDIQFPEGWERLARAGAEIVAWPTASPATVLPSVRAASHRYYVVSSTWRDNSTVFEPTGMVAAQVLPPGRVLVHQVDLSYAIMGWSGFLKDGEALREKYGDRVGFHYSSREDTGLFWSNDPATPIAEMVRAIGGEEMDLQIDRNRRIIKETERNEADARTSIRLKKAEDEATSSRSRAGELITIRSPSGIGGVELAAAEDGWPGELAVRLELRGLESLRIRSGKTAVLASFPSTADRQVRLARIDQDGTEQPLDATTSLAFDLKALDAAGKPAAPPIPRGGFFEFRIPRSLCEQGRAPIFLDWIDFHR